MPILRYCLLSLLALFLSTALFAVEKAQHHYFFEHISTEKGLSSDVILDITQDTQGFLWFCTEDGLNRYDGYTFETYRRDYFDANSLSDNNIVCMAEDHDGRLWIGTHSNGISIYDTSDGSFSHLSTSEGDIRLPSDLIRALHADSKGNMWIGTENYGVLRVDNEGNLTIYRTKYSHLSNLINIKTIYEDIGGRIWIGSWNHGLFYYDAYSDDFTPVELPWSPDINGRPVISIHKDSSGHYWVGSWGHGLFIMQGSVEEGFEVTRHPYLHSDYFEKGSDALAGNIVFSIAEDRNANIWVGSNNGIAIFRQGHFSTPHLIDTDINSTLSPNNSQIYKIYTDKEGLVWIGTRGSGIHKVNIDRHRFFSHIVPASASNIFKETAVFSFIELNEEEVLTGIKSEGFYVYNRSTGLFSSYREFPLYQDFPSNFNTVNSFERDHKGRIWVGTRYYGVFILDHENNEMIRLQDKFSNVNMRKVHTIKRDVDNNMWVGSDNGLYILKHSPAVSGNYEVLHFVNSQADKGSISGNHITAIHQDSRGHYWIGTLNNGVNRFTGIFPGREMFFERFSADPSSPSSLPSNRVNDVIEDRQGRVWIGTEGRAGLSVFIEKDKSFRSYSDIDGMIGDHVFGILEDDNAKLWLSTNRGIIRMNAQDLDNPKFMYYTIADGLQGNVYIKGAKMIASDGTFYMGGYNGFNVFDPGRELSACIIPEVAITKIMFGNEVVRFNPKANEPLLVSNRDKTLSVHYTALSYKDPENNRFAIKLQGFDEEWNYRDASHRQAVYTNLRPGKYTLLIKAANSNGTWSEEYAKLHFQVKPALMASPLAFTMYAIILILIVYGLGRFWMYRTRMQQQLQLERIEQQRIEQVHQLKLRSFSNLSHELLTPLSVINCVLDRPAEVMNIAEDAHKVMSKNVNKLKKLIDQLLLMRKIDIGYMKLSVRRGDLKELLSDIHRSFMPLAAKKDLSFRFICQGESITGYFDPEKMEMMIQNLLSNAIKFTDSGSVVMHCRANRRDGGTWAQISISDTGVGISEKDQERIFERFTRVNEDKAVPGMGIGLDLVNSLCSIHKGRINVCSVPGSESTFMLEIPIYKEAYAAEDISVQPALQPYAEPEVKMLADDKGQPIQGVTVEKQADAPEGAKTILLVEDNNDLRHVLAQSLREHFIVEEAPNGAIALDVARNLSPDLIVSDVIMPEMNGFDLCHTIKYNFETSHIPVILLTARTDDTSKTEAYSYGADSYLTKPVNFDMLLARINGILEAREGLRDYYRRRCIFAPEINNTIIPRLDEEFIEKATHVIEENIENPEFNVQALTDEMATSKSMLYRKFNKLLGVTPNDMIKNIRIRYAADMLANGSATVSEVAYSIGFNDLSYFGKCFKKVYGISPSEYKGQPVEN